MLNFYIYMYLDQNNIPFYIGKGKDYRYHISCHLDESNPNRFLKNKIRKVGVQNVKIHFLHKNLTEEEAFYWESYWIKYIGRRDKKEGSLCNLTDGGEGSSGRICIEETKQKIGRANKEKVRSEEFKKEVSNALKGEKNPMYGVRVSEETKCKLRDAHKGQVPWNKGKKYSLEIRKKISDSCKGRISPRKGVKLSEETKQKMGEAVRNSWKRRKCLKAGI